ncbi:MAG: Undecaprenyl-phosphate mannosyltransferase [bacterium]|nr:Undecaprenyl-phosphate mannosyltransferase [bacterium]
MLTCLLPAYNEAAALPKLLPALGTALQGRDYRILVVDDGSADATQALAREAARDWPVIVEPHDRNRGLGQAMATGFAWVSAHVETPHDVVVALDADNTHPATLIDTMTARIANDTADVVIASRYAPGGAEVGLAKHRQILSRGASWLLSSAFPIPGARDYTCGFRAYRVATLQRAFETYGPAGLVTQRGFACMAEILIKLHLIQARIDEVGLVLRYDLKEGASKLPVARTIQQYLGLIRELKALERQMRR